MVKLDFLQSNQHLPVDALPPAEKQRLYDVMASYGAPQSVAYHRFFRIGFRAWELQGVDAIKRWFLLLHEADIFPPPDDLQPLGAGFSNDIEEVINTPGRFYELISPVRGLRTEFQSSMADLGMGLNAVIQHFTADDWRPYERTGINTIIAEFNQAS